MQAAETLGHYAEWLDVRASQLRQLNRISYATPVVIGRKVKLDFSKVTPDQFEARRAEYHRALQEAFFTQFRIKGTSDHVIKRGESVWVLAQQRYNIPIWLLRQYNPDLDLGSLQPGRTHGHSRWSKPPEQRGAVGVNCSSALSLWRSSPWHAVAA